MPQVVEVAENLKSLFSDLHKTFLHALGICLQFDVLVCSWDELLSIRDYYREGRLCRSLAQFFKLCYAHFGVKLSYAAQLISFMPHIFHPIFSKLIKSSVPSFSIVCDLFTLFYYSNCFHGLFTFLKIYSFISENMKYFA